MNLERIRATIRKLLMLADRAGTEGEATAAASAAARLAAAHRIPLASVRATPPRTRIEKTPWLQTPWTVMLLTDVGTLHGCHIDVMATEQVFVSGEAAERVCAEVERIRLDVEDLLRGGPWERDRFHLGGMPAPFATLGAAARDTYALLIAQGLNAHLVAQVAVHAADLKAAQAAAAAARAAAEADAQGRDTPPPVNIEIDASWRPTPADNDRAERLRRAAALRGEIARSLVMVRTQDPATTQRLAGTLPRAYWEARAAGMRGSARADSTPSGYLEARSRGAK